MHLAKLNQTSYKPDNVASISIALVGLGTLGSELARFLGLLGFGVVRLIDPDQIEPVNILQNIFFREPGNLFQPKAKVIADKGFSYFPQTQWIPLINEIADIGFGDLENCSLIFSATDSTLARVETAYVARRLHIPMVDVGLLGAAYWRGRASWFPAHLNAACYFCQLQESRRGEILAFSQSSTLGCRWVDENVHVPSTPTMSSVVAGMAVDLAFRHGLFANKSTAFAWEIDLGESPALQPHHLAASITCPFHHLADKNILIPLPHDIPLRESLRGLDIDAIELDWPIAVEALCQKCRCTWKPMRRLAWARRHSRCPECGEANHFRFETISRIAANDISARYSPKDLSYSREHLYTPVYHSGRD
jgi:molybdopterin/thiamine biosynthesis adenylyltransferase